MTRAPMLAPGLSASCLGRVDGLAQLLRDLLVPVNADVADRL